MNHTMRRVSYVFLCLVPFLAIPLAGVRALRIPGVYQTIGGLLFAAIVIAAWPLGVRAIKTGPVLKQQQALAGALLLVTFALVSLLWVGLAPPWDAAATEKRMRYLVF